mgnify:CR=1 FL=1
MLPPARRGERHHVGGAQAFSFNVASASGSGILKVDKKNAKGETKKGEKATFEVIGGMCPACEGIGTVASLDEDLIVDRSALDHIVQAGGYISVDTGAAPDAAATPVPKVQADRAFDTATCIGCGACAAACPNASAMLFMGAKVTHLGELPQGQAERHSRVVDMVAQHDHEGFGGCTNIGECAAACPKEIPLDVISTLNADLRQAARGAL